MKEQDLEWWPKNRFKGRKLTIRAGNEKVEIPVPNGDILCDCCNCRITNFPVPVLDGYALCTKCLKQTKKSTEGDKDE